MAIIVDFQPKQELLYNLICDHSSEAFNWIASGGARGGGKSGSIRRITAALVAQYPKIRILIFRKISKNLLKNHIEPFKREYPEIMRYYNKTDNIVRIPNGSLIQFGYGENIDDIGSFQGDEYDVIFIDEATHITEEMIVELSLTNRSPLLKGFVAKMVLTTNPGNIGHKFIKRIFIDKVYTQFEKDHNKYFYLPAWVQDNVVWCEDELIAQGYTIDNYYFDWTDEQRFIFTLKYSNYAQRLAALPEAKKRAYLYGDWDNYEGMFFEKLMRDIHFIRPFDIPSDWYRNGSMDYGNTTTSHILRMNDNGTMFAQHEWTYEKGSAEVKRKDYYDWICKLEIEREAFRVNYDTNMGAKMNELEEKISPADKFISYFEERNPDNQINFVPVTKSKSQDGRNYRHWSNDEVSSLLEWEKDKNGLWIKKPELYIFESCPKLFSTMGQFQTDEDDLDDIDVHQRKGANAIDHWYDSLKYNVMSMNRNAVNSKETSEMIRQELEYKKQYNTY